MKELPEELLYIILCKYSIHFIEPTICSCVYKNKKEYQNKYSSKIVKWYRYNRLNENVVNNYIHLLSKKNLLRFYILYYPTEYLMQYPEFMVSKCNYPLNLLNDLNPMNEKKKERKKSDVLSFLKQSEITKYDIHYTGW